MFLKLFNTNFYSKTTKSTLQAFGKYLKIEGKQVIVMFYAPMSGFCKTLKPKYSAAATELKTKYVLAALNVIRPENPVRKLYNVTEFPTLLCYEGRRMNHTFEGETNKAGNSVLEQHPSQLPVTKSKDMDWPSEPSTKVVHLTESNFDAVLKNENSALVVFYSPWCNHSKRMKPEYEKAADAMQKEKIPGIMAAVDATKELAIARRFNVKGFPVLKYFVNGKFKFDVMVRDSIGIIEFMANALEVPWDQVKSHVVHLTDENFKRVLKEKKTVLVMFYAPWCSHCSKLKPEFEKAAAEFVNDPGIGLAAVDCTKHVGVCASYEVEGYPTVKHFSYLRDVKNYKGGRTAKDLINYLKSPTPFDDADDDKPQLFGVAPGSRDVLILTEKTFDDAVQQNKKVLVLFYAPWCGHCTQMKPAFAKAAQELKKLGVATLAAVDCTTNIKLQERFRVNGFPTIKYFENGKFKKDYDGKRTTESIIAFVLQGGFLNKDAL